MDFLEHALTLAEWGYEVFPLNPKNKTPCGAIVPHGVKEATTNTDTIKQWWSVKPNCNIGIRCNNILVLDLDVKTGKNIKNGPQDIERIMAEVGPIDLSVVARTGSGGWHLFYRRPNAEIKGSKGISWHGVKTGIDIQVGDQYIVAPPSIHPNGQPYQWQTSPVPVAELPTLPDTWVDRVLTHRTPPAAPSPTIGSFADDTVISRCRAYVAAMPEAIDGQQGHAATLRVANAIFHGFGLSESEGWPIMLEYNSRCLPPWSDSALRHKLTQTLQKPPSTPYGYLRDSQLPQPCPVDISEFLKTFESPKSPTEEYAVLPDRFFNVPGFINDYIAYCLARAPHPNKPLALCGALAILSFFLTRKVKAFNGLKPHLYIIALAKSGTGKEFPREVNFALMDYANQVEMLEDTVASGEALEDRIIAYKKIFYMPDEVQSLFQNLANAKDARYNNLVAMLLKLFTAKSLVGRAKAQVKGQSLKPAVCYQPGLVMFGTTLPVHFLQALNEKLITSGLGARCIFIQGEPRTPYNTNGGDVDDLPSPLVEAAQYWANFQAPDPKTGKVGNLADERPAFLTIPATHEAQEILQSLATKTEDEYKKSKNNDVHQTLWTRVHEMASKLATLYSCSANREQPVIDIDAAKWGAELAEWIYRQMIVMIDENMAETPFQRLKQKILQCINRHGGALSRSKLIKLMHVSSRELDEVIKTLLESETIQQVVEASTTRAGLTYAIRPD